MKQRILCATDLTENGNPGIAYGLSLAKKNDAQLIVFHVTSFPHLSSCVSCEVEPYYRWPEPVAQFKPDRVIAEAERRVGRYFCAGFGTESNDVSWKARAALGRVADEIVAAAIQEQVDLIILTRRKMNAWLRFFVPRTTETVSRNAPCPVLLLDSQSAHPAVAWRVPVRGEFAAGF